MNDREYLIILYDYYEELLNDREKENFESYYFDNLSLGEIRKSDPSPTFLEVGIYNHNLQ